MALERQGGELHVSDTVRDERIIGIDDSLHVQAGGMVQVSSQTALDAAKLVIRAGLDRALHCDCGGRLARLEKAGFGPALWLFVALFAYMAWPIDRVGSMLFWPYLAWVTIAGALNFSIWRLNRSA